MTYYLEGIVCCRSRLEVSTAAVRRLFRRCGLNRNTHIVTAAGSIIGLQHCCWNMFDFTLH